MDLEGNNIQNKRNVELEEQRKQRDLEIEELKKQRDLLVLQKEIMKLQRANKRSDKIENYSQGFKVKGKPLIIGVIVHFMALIGVGYMMIASELGIGPFIFGCVLMIPMIVWHRKREDKIEKEKLESSNDS